MAIYKKVPVVTRALNMGEKLRADDVAESLRDVTFSYDSSPALEEIPGKVLRYSVGVGDVVWSRTIKKEKALARGEIVKVIAESENFQIVLMARAEQDGYMGDTIQLKNLRTNKLISGVVADSGEVMIKLFAWFV